MSRIKEYYEADFLEKQLSYYRSLPEKTAAAFLAMEYQRLGNRSKRYLSRVFSCHWQTINKGLNELAENNYQGHYSRQRAVGGGRKKEQTLEQLVAWILLYVERRTAGSPTNEAVKWTDLRPCDIALHLREKYQVEVSHGCIKRVLKGNGYKYRKPAKTLATGESPDRNEQFRIVWFLTALFMEMPNNPIISIDTKKKEVLGQLTRNQPVLSKDGKVEVFDHDYPYLGNGKAIPHGIFDVKENKGYLSLGNSHETAEFVVDNLEWWWENFGQDLYSNATTILILCDSGGANGHRHHLFKKCLQEWAKKIGKRLVICHYPPYCSKYNPIERRLFAQVHRTIERTILTNLEQVKQLMEKTVTKTGLSVEVRVNNKYYPLKQPSLAEEIDEKRILRHPVLPKLSYTILP